MIKGQRKEKVHLILRVIREEALPLQWKAAGWQLVEGAGFSAEKGHTIASSQTGTLCYHFVFSELKDPLCV